MDREIDRWIDREVDRQIDTHTPQAWFLFIALTALTS